MFIDRCSWFDTIASTFAKASVDKNAITHHERDTILNRIMIVSHSKNISGNLGRISNSPVMVSVLRTRSVSKMYRTMNT
jgi:hypothetical protein